MTTRFDQATRRPYTSGKDTLMFHTELRLREVLEHQARLRALRDADRLAALSSSSSERSLRLSVGRSIIRIGRRVAGESLGSPALTG